MRIVHLSDFHIKNKGLKDLETFVKIPLIDDLRKYHQEKPIDLILFTGDLIDRGGNTFTSITDAFNTFDDIVIRPMLNALGLNSSRFIFIPGNHDIDRSADTKVTEDGLTSILKNVQAVSNYIDENNIEGIKRILPFKEFERKFHISSNAQITNYHSNYIVEIEGIKIGISAFNTAWRCYDSETDYQKIVLGVRQISEARDFLSACDFKIALMHHQIDYLAEFETDIVSTQISKDYNILFCGHVHKGSNYSKSAIAGDIIISIAPANAPDNIWNNDQRYNNGYSIIDYGNEHCIIHNRKYSINHDEYIPNTDLAKENGVFKYELKKKQHNNGVKSEYKMDYLTVVKKEQLTQDEKLIESLYVNEDVYENYQIINNERDYKFSSSIVLFKRYLLDIFQHSPKYRECIPHLETIVYTMDRIMLYIQEDNEMMGIILNLNSFIKSIEDNTSDKASNISVLFRLAQWWMDVINELLSIRGEEVQAESLDSFLIELIAQPSEVEDLVEELLSSALESINYLNKGSIARLLFKRDETLISEFFICIFLPVGLNFKLFQKATIGREIGDYESEEIKCLIDSTKNEFINQLETNIGREIEAKDLIESYVQSKITVIKGQKKVGKTALIANFLHSFESRKDFSGTIVLFSFKQSRSLAEFLKSIVQQCNMNIINKMDLGFLDTILKDKEEVTIQLHNDSSKSKNKLLKKIVNESLNRVINECGKVTIIIDSFELLEKHEQEAKIISLLVDLPEKCNLIIATGANNECIDWIIENPSVEKKLSI
ncbi:metallophosphoesterase [Paenibacillus caseinilyticus]|uniref:DDT domain-containing protein n=1 Tax=Paenibacillus mucilaginosus K02 TaxID=997761 RepID=I0BTN0_9BACL|nr:metallophosphoesterase [Paenibacillus mucilaginosus]AFH65727.1 hypothetical protein B2K_34360 [Paenibacillus mucilaginosus K02]